MRDTRKRIGEMVAWDKYVPTVTKGLTWDIMAIFSSWSYYFLIKDE